MGVFRQLQSWCENLTSRRSNAQVPDPSSAMRICRFETVEPRCMLSANTWLGVVYIEEDLGSDSTPDTFQISLAGGEPGAELTHLVIDMDHNGIAGVQDGDLFFDTVKDPSSLGRGEAFGVDNLTKTGTFNVLKWQVVDGTTKIEFWFEGFTTGDMLTFTVDVDEANNLAFDPNNQNAGVDRIASGNEMQASQLLATIKTPYFKDHIIDTANPALFVDNYSVPTTQFQSRLTDDGESNRTAAAFYNFEPEPLPVTIEGTVWHDRNLDLDQDSGELGISKVELSLYKLEGLTYVDTGHRAITDSNGDYKFGEDLSLLPGTYQVRETQPEGWISVGAVPGTVEGSNVGTVDTADTLTSIFLPHGGQHAINYDFAEAKPAKLSGHVYHDKNDNGVFDPGEKGLGGVEIQIIPVKTIAPQGVITVVTDADGYYVSPDLMPGRYRVVEPNQPLVTPGGTDRYLDGKDAAGTVDGAPVGATLIPDADEIAGIVLISESVGIDYDFGEILPTAIHGNVHITKSIEDCFGESSNHVPAVGLTVQLLDESGKVIQTTTTDENGDYEFTNLTHGNYQVHLVEDSRYIDGGEKVGHVSNVKVGRLLGDNTIAQINLSSGDVGIEYDFCLHPPATISGYVYHDKNDDGLFDSNEDPIKSVVVMLLDEEGKPVAQTKTDELGYYLFTDLEPGTYTVMEVQPGLPWIDGKDTPGTVNGSPVGIADSNSSLDKLRQVKVDFADNAINYNFGEILPASISGIVHADPNQDCHHQENETLLDEVRVDLVDENGKVVATAYTNSKGEYKFDELRPGLYTVQFGPKAGYFYGGQITLFGNGDDSQKNVISEITIVSGDILVEYNACRIPPAEISGYVFQDGPAFVTSNGLPPSNVHQLRDGVFTSDDKPIAGVTLELRNGLSGEVVTNERALPGYYSDGPIRVTTDANGFYIFKGLKPGSYSVFEVHPENYTDSRDTPGTSLGIAINPGDSINPFVLQSLTVNPADDAILRINLSAGEHAQQNNFSEVRIISIPFEEPPEDLPPPPVLPPPLVVLPPPVPTPFIAPLVTPAPPEFGGSVIGYTWHLSVVDAGAPRGESYFAADMPQWVYASYLNETNWAADPLNTGNWSLYDISDDQEIEILDKYQFGRQGAIPVSGDFNGDGIDEIGIFFNGEWYIDINGNGIWDSEDLWAQLGGYRDLPATGDWDGDGKDDIAIFGPAWPGDPRAIKADPGLPAPWNQISAEHSPKNVPPEEDVAAVGTRVMRNTVHGDVRDDLIDHVFRFGVGGDKPVAGDWNGDGIRSIAIFRNGRWNLDVDGDGRWSEGDIAATFGEASDHPVVGDFNGDGIDDIGVFRDGTWLLDTNGNRELDAHDKVIELGVSGDFPITGDWDGDGVDEIGVYHDQPNPVSNPGT